MQTLACYQVMGAGIALQDMSWMAVQLGNARKMRQKLKGRTSPGMLPAPLWTTVLLPSASIMLCYDCITREAGIAVAFETRKIAMLDF